MEKSQNSCSNSFLAAYMKERTGADTYHDDDGFFTHRPEDSRYRMLDFYVKPESRKQGISKKYLNMCKEIAKEKGYTKVLGSVCIDAINWETSIKIVYAIGFNYLNADKNMIYFEVEV